MPIVTDQVRLSMENCMRLRLEPIFLFPPERPPQPPHENLSTPCSCALAAQTPGSMPRMRARTTRMKTTTSSSGSRVSPGISNVLESH